MKKLLLASCIAFAFSSPAYSALSLQDEIDPEEEFGDEFDGEFGDFYGGGAFVSIATGTQTKLEKAPAIASIITSEEFRNLGFRTLSEALSLIPGMNISRSSQMMAPKFNVRGITSTFGPQTLLMIDGSPIKSAVRGDNQIVWGEYPLAAVERIEIIRGPGSALYGADAFAGVINIITRGFNDDQDSTVGAYAGSFDTVSGWLNHSTKIGALELSLNLQITQSDGQDSTVESDAQTGLDILASDLAGLPPVSHAPGKVNTGHESRDLYLKGQYDGFGFDIALLDRSDVGTGQGIAEALDPVGKFGSHKHLFNLKYESANDQEEWNFSAKFSYLNATQEIEENLTLLPAGTLFGSFPNGLIGNPEYEEDKTSLSIKLDNSSITDHFFSIGFGFSKTELFNVKESKNFNPDLSPRTNGLEDVSNTSEVFIPEAKRDSKFLFLQDIWKIAPDWEMTAGIRYDDYSDFGSTVNPRAALVWSSSLNTTTKLLYGRAFRAPAFAELLTVNNPVALGNEQLSPEIIDTIELAYGYKDISKFTANINLFYYQIDDLITFVPDEGAPTQTAQNVGERSGIGLELETTFNLSEQIDASASYSYVKAEDDITGKDVGDYPNSQLKAKLRWSINSSWEMSSTLNWVGDRKGPSIDSRAVGGVPNIPYDIPQAGVAAYLKISKGF